MLAILTDLFAEYSFIIQKVKKLASLKVRQNCLRRCKIDAALSSFRKFVVVTH